MQVDANGGGNDFVTVATLTAGVNATIEYATSATTTATVAIVSGAPPVVLDLDGDGVEYLGLEAGVTFDYGGGAVSTAWVGVDDGLLVRDANGDGTISGSELMFARAGSDLDGLSAYDSNGDGQLSSGDADFGQFGVWQDADSDGVVDGGELVSLTAVGISSIGLSSNGLTSVAASGDVLVAGEGSYTYVNDNGATATGLLADVSFRTARDADQAQRVSGTINNTGVVAAAVAAMGLVAGQAAAHVAPQGDEGHVFAASSGGLGQLAQAVAAESNVASDAGGSLLSGESHVAVDHAEPTAARSASAHAVDAKLDASSANEGHAPAELLSATELHANDAAAASPVAPMIVMPSVEALGAMAGEAHGNGHGGTVADVIAAALEGGAGGGDIGALLAALPGSGGENAALEALATPHGEAVPGWDMGHFGYLQTDALMNIVADVSRSTMTRFSRRQRLTCGAAPPVDGGARSCKTRRGKT